MKTSLLVKRTICAVPLLFAASLVPAPAQAAEERLATVAPGSADPTEPGLAAGAAEDTLQACMGRIPKDASIGQRMIAEQGCWRDESDRKPFQTTPGARNTGHHE